MNQFLLINNYYLITLIISLLIIISSIMLIINTNPIHSLLFLVLTFILTTCMFLLFKVEFISMLFLVVYLGAIIVLFLFVVMMLNIRILALNEKMITYFPISFFILFCFFLELLFILHNKFIKNNNFILNNNNIENITDNNWLYSYSTLLNSDLFNQYFIKINNTTNLHNISIMLYSDNIYVFILGSIILLIGMLGAIILTLQKQRNIRGQDYYEQNSKTILKSIQKLK